VFKHTIYPDKNGPADVTAAYSEWLAREPVMPIVKYPRSAPEPADAQPTLNGRLYGADDASASKRAQHAHLAATGASAARRAASGKPRTAAAAAAHWHRPRPAENPMNVKIHQDPENGHFQITDASGRKSIVRIVYVLAYVDDLETLWQDPYDDKYIWITLSKRFELKKTDSRFMLGLTRDVAPDGLSVKIAMAGYIETMYEEYSDICARIRRSRTPVPPHTYLSNGEVPAMTEKERKLRQTELLRPLGKLLWVARMVMPTLSFGVHSCCRLMANPTDEAIKCCFSMVKYAYEHRHDGITFRKVDKPEIVCYYDASNKNDPADGDRAQAGFIVFLGEGPISWRSFRLTHVGLSAQHNEYMCLAHASQEVTWIRYVMGDMELFGMIVNPSVMLGDNDAATSLARERDLVTTQNKFYSRLCHYAKECMEEGRTCPRRAGTKDNLSDGFTKAVDADTHDNHYDQVIGKQAKPPVPPMPRG
jgi:hypothetical protein